MTGMIKVFFLCLKFLASIFLDSLIYLGIFLGIQNNLRTHGSACVTTLDVMIETNTKNHFLFFFRYIINYCVLEIFKAWEFGMGFFGG